MLEFTLPYLAQQIIYQSPLLLVCVIGTLLAIAYRHIGIAATLLMTGCLLLLLTIVTGALAQSYLLERHAKNWSQYGFMSAGILIGVSISVRQSCRDCTYHLCSTSGA